ncbi:MAG: flavodoxin-dependent (E)-4-hydroxy-3-methylbut-2-enyl-diphosphate synthase [Limnochordia bacterium]|jgi:(E)-4-hydroxy-3-methylbut-2-enyl-diphosphate synthase|nr:flavodoxin-dependent (E)-4-hydroxy-3-methylbut-2-enyl-diphosphate synthase [Limnochordia bacterium]MDD2628942.1 flavodoxin-dependent (E)-4-hydroxy-3-methylbut-2-enyl-diphosphate synthase [Limnochordia bacterium]
MGTDDARRKTQVVAVGNVAIGGGAPISVQSMCNTKTTDVAATLSQIREVAEIGCDIIRVAVPDDAALAALPRIVQESPLPVVADIHFRWDLALGAIGAGVAKLRLNPGNINEPQRVKDIAHAAKEKGIPIRIGVNSGSVAPRFLDADGHPTAHGLVESALGHVALLEAVGFEDIVISIKATSAALLLEANLELAQRVAYPLHLGLTEAGPYPSGAVRSAAALGAVLSRGIGDTVRVSLTGDVTNEVRVAHWVLGILGLRQINPIVISCPTCARCKLQLEPIAQEVERRTAHLASPLKIAVMGCVVNGPGEAKEADIGIAGGDGCGYLFRRGERIRKVAEEDIVDVLVEEAEKLAMRNGGLSC